MTSFLSKINPTAKSIQKEYVAKRQRSLYANDPAKTERVKKKVEALMVEYKVTGDWYEHYLKIHKGLQNSHLTINIDAISWFSKENTYDAYAQMYERAVGPDKKMALKSDSFNPAQSRAMADDLVTIPDEWANAHPFSQRKRIHRAMNASGVSLKKVNESRTGIGSAGSAHARKLKGDEANGFSTTNSSFMPTAKQVFAALNYGMRPHGSTTFYGFSYLVLNPALQVNALYYPGDTFFTALRGTAMQATFNTIGAMLEHVMPRRGSLGGKIWESCHDLRSLEDTNEGDLLVEAHIFKKLKLAEDVQTLVLSRLPRSNKPAMSNQEWDTVVKNATKWCARYGIRLTFASP